MTTFNLLQASLRCPHCNTLVNAEIKIFFGNTSQMERFIVGDQYQWLTGKAVQNGGRPEMGDLDGEGYTECPHCQRDFFVKVIIRQDKIEGIKPDLEKAGHKQNDQGKEYDNHL